MIKGAFSTLSPFTKLLLIFLLVLGSSILITMLFVLAAIPFTGIDEINAMLTGGVSISYLRFLQVVQGFSVFIIPSFLIAWLLSDRPWLWLGFRKINWTLVTLSIVLFFVCQPLVSFLAKLNSTMVFPDFLLPVEEWMHNAEKTAGKLVLQFLDTKEPWTIFVNVLMIVFLPAIGEEMLFRGAIQPVIGQWTKNQHLAVWITAFLFSAMHIQFMTFLPRFLLGGILGYLLIYGKNIWYPIAGHFVNNLLSLIVFYYYRTYKPHINPMDADTGNYNNWMVFASILFIVAIILFIKNKTLIKADDVDTALGHL